VAVWLNSVGKRVWYLGRSPSRPRSVVVLWSVRSVNRPLDPEASGRERSMVVSSATALTASRNGFPGARAMQSALRSQFFQPIVRTANR
jgi:hypothetical protein